MPLLTVAHPCGDLVHRISLDETRKQQKLHDLYVIHDRPDHARSNRAFGDEHVIEMHQKHLVLARRVVNLETLVKTLTVNQPADTEEDLDGSHTPGPEVQGGSNFEDEDNDVREELSDNLPAEAPDATSDDRVQADSVDITNGDNDVPEAAPAATGEGAMLSDNWGAQSLRARGKSVCHRQSVSYSLAGVLTRKPAPDIVISDDKVEDPPKEVIVISDDSEDEDEVPLHGKCHFVSAGPSTRNHHDLTIVNRCPGNLVWFRNKEGLSVEFHVSRIRKTSKRSTMGPPEPIVLLVNGNLRHSSDDQNGDNWNNPNPLYRLLTGNLRMTTATSRDDEWDPRFTTVKITKGQAELLRSKFPQYEAEYRRLNPSLRMWKEMSSAAHHTLRLLSERLVDECMEHKRFGGGLKLELLYFAKGLADNLKNTHVQDSITIRTDSGTDEGIHKLGKMLKLSGTITGRQWFELSKKEELRKDVEAKKWEAEWKGHPFNPTAEYQNILKQSLGCSCTGNTLEGKRFSDMWTHHEQGKSVQEQHSSWLDRLAKQTHQLLPVTHEEPDCVPDNDTIDSSPAVSLPALTDTPSHICSRRRVAKPLPVEEPTPSSSSKDQVPVFVPPTHNSPDATIPNDDEDSSQPEQTRSSPVLEARHGNQSPPSQLNLIDVADVPSPLTDNSELQSELRALLANVMMEPEAGDEEMASDHEEVDSDLEEGGRDHEEGGRDRGQDEAKGHGKGTRKTRKRKSKAKRTAVKVGKTVESTGGTSLSTAMMVTKGRNGRQGAKAQERNKTPPPKAKNWKWQSPGTPKPLLDQAPDTTLPRTRLGNKHKTEDRCTEGTRVWTGPLTVISAEELCQHHPRYPRACPSPTTGFDIASYVLETTEFKGGKNAFYNMECLL
ncbi:hypothetical protein IW261DRAFT_1420664 [Armillaria novae-zelandiae]|uniref:Uncharacterized protein n=1 Tax=Armillaria novae-zelandiae TaxID=153914 RepID=A0AA39P573_9AGAR|nr:hypothetical protein IW261DRAFT_1420664 [Armillaria novae-zelandiae]